MSETEKKAPDVYVRGVGTPTSKSEEHFEERYQDAEKRRDVADAERKIASQPIEKGGGKLFVNQLTSHPEVNKAYVLLKYVTRGGDETGYECLADIIVGSNPLKPTALTLMIVCPRCAQGQKRLQDCQLAIHQWQKYFELKTGMGPAIVFFEGDRYRSAGVITESERFTCTDCGWTARIDNNRVWPD